MSLRLHSTPTPVLICQEVSPSARPSAPAGALGVLFMETSPKDLVEQFLYLDTNRYWVRLLLLLLQLLLLLFLLLLLLLLLLPLPDLFLTRS